MLLIGLTTNFWIALVLLVGWALVFAVEWPLRQAYLNGLIPSEQRATVLSFDSLMGSVGGAIAQPALGRSADVFGYGASYVISAGVMGLSIPFVILARREKAASDPITGDEEPVIPPSVA